MGDPAIKACGEKRRAGKGDTRPSVDQTEETLEHVALACGHADWLVTADNINPM